MKDTRSRMVWIGLLLALGAGGLFCLMQEPAAVADTAHAQREPAAAPEPVFLEPAPVTVIERAEVPAATPGDAGLAHTKGRCVDEGGEPLAGCSAKLRGYDRAGNDATRPGKEDWHDPEPVMTGDDGRFDIAFTPPSGRRFALTVQADRREPRTTRWGHWDRIAAAQVIDLGDITLPRGFEVRGRVVDAGGAAVEGLRVGVRLLLPSTSTGIVASDDWFGTSSANGDFVLEAPIPAGTWPLALSGTDQLLLQSPEQVTVDRVRGAEPLLVVLRTVPSIAGIVVDDHGLPVAGVTIAVEMEHSGSSRTSHSLGDGTFEIFAAVAEPKAVRLEVMDPGPCERSWHDDQLHAWGSKDVRIVLARALSFELCVVERGTGAAVTQYEVRCHRVKSGSSGDRRGRLPGEHPEGRVTVDHVRRGRNVLRVFPTDKALLPSAGFEFEATDAGVPPIRVEIDRMQPAVVRATTSTSAPVAGSKVEVIAKGSRPPRVGEVLDPRLGMDMGGSSDPKFRYPELRSSGVTDSNGRAAVFVPADDNGLIVRITGAAHPTALVDPARFPPAHELVVVVADGGAINGTVLLHALDRRRVSVHLRRGDTNERPPPHQDHSVLDADGRFVLRGLAPGRYRIDLEYASQYRTGWAGDGAMPVDIKVPEVTVEAGRVSEITVDATAVSPASVRGRVLVNGAPPALVHVFVEREYNMRFGQFVPAADGTFEAADLMPGTYHAGLVVGFTTGEGCEMLQQESFVLAAGQQLVRDFLFVRRRLVVHLLQADGKTPAANVACTCNGEQFFLRRTSDADGRFVVDPAPADAFQVYTGQSGDTSLGQVEVPAGKIEHEVMLTLPATKAK